ncbi:MAG: hypothetical protein ACNA7W_11070 [Pseudomonadales bacterium]
MQNLALNHELTLIDAAGIGALRHDLLTMQPVAVPGGGRVRGRGGRRGRCNKQQGRDENGFHVH